MTGKDRQDLCKGLAFCSPWIIGFLVFTLLPLVLSLYYSFCDYSLLQRPVWIGTQNYQRPGRTMTSSGRRWAIRSTTPLVALPVGMLISLGLALLLNQNIKGQSFYRTIIFLPSLVPAVASAMLWLWLFNAKLGLINGAAGWSIGRSVQGRHLAGCKPIRHWADARRMPICLMSFWGVGNRW